MEAALECLARLDAGKDGNDASVAKVAADVAHQLGAHAGEYQQLLRDGLQMSRDKMDAMQEVLIKNANSNAEMVVHNANSHAEMLAGKVDASGARLARIEEQLSEMALAQKDERKDLEKVQSGVQGSTDSFEALFELAPYTVEEWAQMHPLRADAANDDVEERSELGEGNFGITSRMSLRIGAKLVGVKSGQLFAVKKVVLQPLYSRQINAHLKR